MSLLSWLNEALERAFSSMSDGTSTARHNPYQDRRPTQNTESADTDLENDASTEDEQPKPMGDTSSEVPSKRIQAGDQQSKTPSIETQSQETGQRSHRKTYVPSHYRATLKEAKQITTENNTTYSLDEYHPDSISPGSWVSALSDLEKIIEQEKSGESDKLQDEQDASKQSDETRDDRISSKGRDGSGDSDKKHTTDTGAFDTSLAGKKIVPIAYQQLWSKTNRLLSHVEYDESLDEYHPDTVSPRHWDTAHDELEAHFDTLQKKKVESGHPDTVSPRPGDTVHDELEAHFSTLQKKKVESVHPDSADSDKEHTADTGTSDTSSTDEESVPITYQQLWSRTNRLLSDVEYDESLDEYHPDTVSPRHWDMAHDELEAHFNTIKKKKVESVHPGSAQHQTKQTNQDMYQSRIETVIDFEDSDLSPAAICDDHQQLTKWLKIWARWEGLRRLSEIERVAAPLSNINGVGEQLTHSLHSAGYEALGSIRKASVEELQDVDGIGQQRAQSIYEAACVRQVGDIQGVGETLEQQLLNEGIRTALDLTGISKDTLTAIDGIGSHRALQLQGRAAAWLPPRCDPPSQLYSSYQPPYQSLSTATDNIDRLERVLHRYSEIEPLIDQLTDSSLTVPADFDLEEVFLEDLVLDPVTADRDANDMAEPTWKDVLERLAKLVADNQRCSELSTSVQAQFDLPAIQSPDISFVDIWSADTPVVALEHLTELERKISHIDEFIEASSEAAETHAQIQESSVAVASSLESAVSRHITRLRTEVGDESFADTRGYVATFCKVCTYAISLSKKYSSYPFETTLRTLSATDQNDPVPVATLLDLLTIFQTTEEALDFIGSIDYEHPAVDQSAWEESITLALEEEYPQAIQPISNQLSRLEHGIWDRDDLSDYEWQSFERLIGDLYRDEGHNTTVTQSTNDLGVDIWANTADRRLAIQVKHYQAGQSVGRETLQQLVSTLAKGDADEAVVVTSGDFADTAKRYADDFGDNLSLIGSEELIRRFSESSVPPKTG